MMPVPGGGRAQDDLAGAVTALDVVVQRAAFAQRHADQRALGGFGGLADGFRHFARLAVAEADAALLVANDDQGGEAEARPPFTTLATRLMWTSLSTNSQSRSSRSRFDVHEVLSPWFSHFADARDAARLIPGSFAIEPRGRSLRKPGRLDDVRSRRLAGASASALTRP